MSATAPEKHQPHVIPVKVYVAVWGALMVLTVITVVASRINLGPVNTPLALLIATTKAALVALFFMHLLYDDRYNIVIFGSSILFLAIFLGLTWIDPYTRGDLNEIERYPIRPEMGLPGAPVAVPGGAAAGPTTDTAPTTGTATLGSQPITPATYTTATWSGTHPPPVTE